MNHTVHTFLIYIVLTVVSITFFFAAGAWILSSDWIAESMKVGTILAEEDFEIIRNSKAHRDNAPRRARLDVHSRSSSSDAVQFMHMYMYV